MAKKSGENSIVKEPVTFDMYDRATDHLDLPDTYDDKEMLKDLCLINGLWDTSLDIYRGKVTGLRTFIKKLSGKFVFAIMNQHVERQIVFNSSLSNCMNMLYAVEKENEELRKEVEDIKKRIADLQETKNG